MHNEDGAVGDGVEDVGGEGVSSECLVTGWMIWSG